MGVSDSAALELGTSFVPVSVGSAGMTAPGVSFGGAVGSQSSESGAALAASDVTKELTRGYDRCDVISAVSGPNGSCLLTWP